MTVDSETSSTSLASYPSLRDRRVFITGGATGIGETLVQEFAAQGAKVAFVDIAEAEGKALATKVNAWFRKVDVRDIAALQTAIREAAEELGDFNVLVNNVANDDRHKLEDITAEYYDNRIGINQRPALFAIQAVTPGMKRLGGGSIINFGSISWQAKMENMACYMIAKSAVDGLTRGLSRTLGRDKIRINTVTPGAVSTERQRKLWLTPEALKEIDAAQCLPITVVPLDIARMVLFLASDDSRACTAQEFKVDAGFV
ncbi:short-chain dehydrogenase/reductase sdr [Gonapodya prolifera JEL478]|uniref:Short-chain dehydrogenase/reductase sdr n=1 Tax=Gonapodya prolifera (strain JEL478) TaxID=1344416 RepID=A0A139AEV8_GONPJ|nr:short-chain dehydrogenase/reductase sdr [Gonapodya prolifera JEL478]|eukprot:KXS14965.1 short-chain dehydrogenase/reductase sdr [Gonapodya prolifera JEL478]